MVKPYQVFLAVVFLVAVSGCSLVLPPYVQPEDGPRAKVRVMYGGGNAKFHPGKDCQIGRNKFGLDVMGVRIPGFGNQRKLGIPLQPDDDWYDELYIRANEPLTARFVYRAQKGKYIEECATRWFTFVPELDGNYEMSFKMQSGAGCAAVLDRIVETSPGQFRRETMPMRSPAPVKCGK